MGGEAHHTNTGMLYFSFGISLSYVKHLPLSIAECIFPVVQGSDGLAGFSVVGGRDQPQLPNPGAFIVTTVTSGGPADGVIKLV